jgi:ribose transport system ATP-binding protein
MGNEFFDERQKMIDKTLLNLVGISKTFPGSKALNEVNFSLNRGEIVSIVGQNGAGKSTLVSIIGGIYVPDSGEIFIDGRKVRILNPAMAEGLGIGMVHQEPTLVPMMDVASNLFLNREHIKSRFVLDFKKMKQESEKILNLLCFAISPEKLVEDLTIVEREVVEIAKAMLLNPRILILDEVTAPLGAGEVEHLFELIKDLKAKGMSIIFISHRLQEVIQISDRVVVLRDGEKVGDLNIENSLSMKRIIDLMLGEKTVEDIRGREEIHIKRERILMVKNLSKNRVFK